MKLTPREKDKLFISVAAEVAKKRLNRGLKLNYPEVVAIISDYVLDELAILDIFHLYRFDINRDRHGKVRII